MSSDCLVIGARFGAEDARKAVDELVTIIEVTNCDSFG